MILVPYASFEKCSECFDDRTRVRHVINIYKALVCLDECPNNASRFENLWAPYKQALIQYGTILAEHCFLAGRAHIYEVFTGRFKVTAVIKLPKWLGWERLHVSHRSRLVHLENRRIVKRGYRKYAQNQRVVRSLHDWCTRICGTKLSKTTIYDIGRLKDTLSYDLNVTLERNYYASKPGFQYEVADNLVWPARTPISFSIPTQVECQTFNDLTRAIVRSST